MGLFKFPGKRERKHLTQQAILVEILETLEDIREILRPKHRDAIVRLVVNHRSIKLLANEVTHMSTTTVSIGHTVALALEFDDANGNPMLTPVTPDAPPTWTQTTAATGTLAASGDGLSAVYTPGAVGTDTVTVSLAVGGVAFTGTADINVTAAPQVLSSVKIVPTVQ